jgi:hypothetical protein
MNDTIHQKRARIAGVHRVVVLLLPPVVGFDAGSRASGEQPGGSEHERTGAPRRPAR